MSLDTIVELSHEFGTPEYVIGGGGNTSAKDHDTLWVKPSVTTLSGLTAETFVVMNRAAIAELYAVTPPAKSDDQEALVKELMGRAVENDTGRPSVEAPLHNVLDATYVVHTHPVLVNGLTCAKDGEAACKRLFPDALWVPYIDPGYTLCMEVRGCIEQYRAVRGCEPALIVLQNHGIFVASDSAEEIRELYARVLAVLTAEYVRTGVSQTLAVSEAPESSEDEDEIRFLFGAHAAHVASCGLFSYAPGPISPDHLVYAKAFPFVAELSEADVAQYLSARGYAPNVVIAGERVYGLGASQKSADLALEFAKDGALVMQLAAAFGGLQYMTDQQREFIENWEVESYRQKQIS